MMLWHLKREKSGKVAHKSMRSQIHNHRYGKYPSSADAVFVNAFYSDNPQIDYSIYFYGNYIKYHTSRGKEILRPQVKSKPKL